MAMHKLAKTEIVTKKIGDSRGVKLEVKERDCSSEKGVVTEKSRLKIVYEFGNREAIDGLGVKCFNKGKRMTG